MRFALVFLIALVLPLPDGNGALAQSPGVAAERIKRASAVKAGYGAVVISIRSELYLDEPIDVFFLKEGGDSNNNSDVVRFSRRQNPLSFSNSSVKHKVRAYQLPAGTYRLIAHGMDCPKVPAENERCLIDRTGLTDKVEISRPSRGYGEIAPTFEVHAGQMTYAGDFALTARNTLEWSELPSNELAKIRRRMNGMPQGPSPVIPESFKLKYGLFPRSYGDDRRRRY
ncbi:MAG: hypothetical protein AAGI28_05325 [Pseudomonadota bacterium]